MNVPPDPVSAAPPPLSRIERIVGGFAQGCALVAGLAALVAAIAWFRGWWAFATFGSKYVPIAPGTAWLLVLLSSALFLHARWPLWRPGRRWGFVATAFVGGTTLLVLTRSHFPFVSGIEDWLAHTHETVGDIPVGRMSPHSAVIILFAAAALGCLLGARRWRRVCRGLAFILGAAVLGGSAHVIASYAVGVPLLYGSGLIPMALLSGIVGAILGLGLVAAAHPERWLLRGIGGPSTGTRQVRSRRFTWALAGIFLVLVTGIGTVGYVYLRRELAATRRGAEQELSIVADLKARRIQEWRDEILGDANWIQFGSMLGSDVCRFLDDPVVPGGRQRLIEWLVAWQKYQGGSRVLLADLTGRVLLAAPTENFTIGSRAKDFLIRTVEERKVLILDLHESASVPGTVNMDIFVPILDRSETSPSGSVVGVLMIEIDPEAYLFPMIEEWPTPSSTAETLLVRRDGDQVVYLNQLRHRKNSALELRVPMARREVPAVRAVLGEEGMVEGSDYRDVPVLAALRRIPDSPWFIVAKQDQAEIFSRLRQQAWTTGVVVGALVLTVVFGLALLWRRRERLFAEQELSERVASEARLKASEERFRSLFVSMSEGAVLHELVRDPSGKPTDYRIIELNPAFERHTGIPIGTARGALASVLYSARPPPFLDRYAEVATTGIAQSFEVFFPPLGRHFLISVFAPGADRFATVFQDVTERRRAEQERAALVTDLERANAELEGMIYVASHDLRAPLVNLQGFGQRLEKNCGELVATVQLPGVPAAVREEAERILGERIPGALKYIRSSTEKMDALVNGLLKVSRLGHVPMHVEPLDMDRLLQEVIAAQTFQFQAAEAVVHVEPLPACRGDANLLNQVFSNLLDNALKYRDPARALRVHVSGQAEARQVIYEVSDNGVGIAPEHRDKIWEMFHRLDPAGPVAGDGLGLNLVRRILDRHRGRIWVESTPGQGSRFFVALPRAEDSTAATGPGKFPSSSSASAEPQRGRIGE